MSLIDTQPTPEIIDEPESPEMNVKQDSSVSLSTFVMSTIIICLGCTCLFLFMELTVIRHDVEDMHERMHDLEFTVEKFTELNTRRKSHAYTIQSYEAAGSCTFCRIISGFDGLPV